MAAFNWLLFDSNCPKCGNAIALKAQCHAASSFSGDESGRFNDRPYKLGQKMAWWNEDDPRWSSWKEGGQCVVNRTDSVRECCYTKCPVCGARLYAVIQFDQATPVAVLDVGPEENWPDEYKK